MTEFDTLPDEMILNIHSIDKTVPENLTVTLGGREILEPAFVFKNEKFIQKLEQLEEMIRLPLPCDAKGVMGSKENDLESAIYEQSVTIGTGLADILDDMGRQTLTEMMNSTKIPLLRIVVDGDWADRVLALPWELLYIDGRFPVKEARLDVVREVSVANAPGLEPQTTPFRVLVHIAAPEADDGQSSLMYEEEAYRLVLSMQQVAKDAVAFSDLGTARDLVRAVRNINPTVVHFTGHGSPGTLLFENEIGENAEIPISYLLTQMRASAVGEQPVLPQVFYLASCYGASGTANFTPAAKCGYRQLSELGAVKGEGPSTATTIQRQGCPAVVAYFGPVGDQLSTRAETIFYSGLAAGKKLTESVRSARIDMAGVLGEKDKYYRYPLGWAQLALYLRGNDISISKAKTGGKAADDIYVLEQQLYRPDSPVHSLDMLHSGIDGFIGRRKDLAMLGQRHIKGQRLFVLYGLGGIGKTALAVNLIPKLGIDQDKIVILDAARADKAANPFQDLWEQMTDQLQDAFPDILASILETYKQKQDPEILLGAMIAAVKDPWLVYLDNAESLQVKVNSENGDLGAWASQGISQWWQIVAAGAFHGGSLTLMATTRYLWEGIERKDSWQPGVLRPSDIARMMRWFPYLRQISHENKMKIIEWLNGHARALIYLEGLFKEILDSQTPEDDISAERWQAAIEQALPQTDEKLENEDLMLSHILKRLDTPAKDQLRVLTALRSPAPLDALNSLGDQTGRLESLGLITKFSGKFYGMHASVSRFVELLCGPAGPEDHLRIGLWYDDAYKAEKRLVFVEEAVYHLVTAEKADLAATPAADLASHYLATLRYAESGQVIDSVIALSPSADLTENLLAIRGYLHNALGRYEFAAADFQEMIESARKRETEGIAEAQGLHGLANALVELGRYDEAVEAFNKSLGITKQIYGTEAHPDYATSIHGLANALVRLGRYEEAVEAFNQSLSIKKRIYGSVTHPDYAASLSGLANALSSLGRYEEAVEAYNKSLNIKKEAFGSDEHPESLPTRTNLGMALAKMGRIDQASREMDRALSIARTMGHPFHTGNILVLYAQVEAARNTQKAIDMAVEAEALLMQLFETSHPTLQEVRALIAGLKGGPEPESDPATGQKKQRAKVTPDMLKDWAHELLHGVPSVSRVVFVHLAQRIALLISTQGILTQLAVRMGKPGLELEDPTALEMPEDMPPEQIQELKSRLAYIKALMKTMVEDINDRLRDYPEQNGRIVLNEDLSCTVPDGLSTVLLDEAAAIILVGSDELLRAELDLVLKGLSILLKDEDDPAAIGLPTTLLRRLPDQREKIVNTLKPFCSERQKKLLLETKG
ncbi:MAG: DUF3856 domain-containing protein [Pseudomonadota bacterium]